MSSSKFSITHKIIDSSNFIAQQKSQIFTKPISKCKTNIPTRVNKKIEERQINVPGWPNNEINELVDHILWTANSSTQSQTDGIHFFFSQLKMWRLISVALFVKCN